MIDLALAEKVCSLLTHEKLSHRKVAKLTGVSRRTIADIASGEWFDRYARRNAKRQGQPALGRCPNCGALVRLPCRACEVKRLKAAGSLPPLDVAEDGPPRLELEGAVLARYLEVRAAALQRGEPNPDPDWDPAPAEVDPWEEDERLADVIFAPRKRWLGRGEQAHPGPAQPPLGPELPDGDPSNMGYSHQKLRRAA